MRIKHSTGINDYVVNPNFSGFDKKDRNDLATLLLRHGFIDITRKTYSEYGREYKWAPYSDTNKKFYFRKGYKRHVTFDYENIYVCSQIDDCKSHSDYNVTLAELSFHLGLFFFVPGVKYSIRRNKYIPSEYFYSDVVFTGFGGVSFLKPNGTDILHTSKKNEFVLYYTFINHKQDNSACMNWEAPKIFTLK